MNIDNTVSSLPHRDRSIAIAVITHNRVGVLRACVNGVLARTSPLTTQIVIWNNGSTDGTSDYLDSLDDSRLRVVHHPKNIGLSAYARAFEHTTAAYLVELDDDVTNAPLEWDRMLLDALERLPTVGFLAADLEENDADVASRLRHRDRADHYEEEYVNDVRLLSGPTGGACAMTSRAIYDKAGGFPQNRRIFFQEEANYIARVEALGLRKAILADLRVSHTGGEYAGGAAAKDAYWRDHWRTVRRKNFIKRLLFAFPGVPALNARFSWFGPLEEVAGTPPRTVRQSGGMT